MSEPMTGLPPEKFVCLHPVGKELQLERVGLTAPGQVIVELYKGGDFCKTQIFKLFLLGVWNCSWRSCCSCRWARWSPHRWSAQGDHWHQEGHHRCMEMKVNVINVKSESVTQDGLFHRNDFEKWYRVTPTCPWRWQSAELPCFQGGWSYLQDRQPRVIVLNKVREAILRKTTTA